MSQKHAWLYVALPPLVSLSSAAGAQESTAYGTAEYGGGWAVPSLDTSQSIIRDVINRRMIDDVVLGKNRSTTVDNGGPETEIRSGNIAAAARLSFVASPQRRIKNYGRFIAQTQTAASPGAASFYDKMFTTNRYIETLDGTLQTKGLKSNSIADAFATYWISTWLASRERLTPVSPAQAEATRAMAVKMLSNMPSLTSMSHAAKQEIADDLFIKAGLLDGLLALSANDPGARKTIAQVARQGAQKWGLDLDAMSLGPNGFGFGRVK